MSTLLRNQTIVSLYSSGASIPAISKSHDLTPTRVYQILRAAKYPLRKKYPIVESFFDFIDTENKAYILGLLFADGYNNQDNGWVRLQLQSNDKPILLAISKLTYSADAPLKDVPSVNQTALFFYSRRFSNALAKWGVSQRKSFTVRFPFISKKLYPDFIRGVFDGDGCISQGRASIAGSEAFLQDIKSTLKSHYNLLCGLHIYKRYRTSPNKIGCLFFNKKQSKDLARLLYQKEPNLFLRRKRIKFE